MLRAKRLDCQRDVNEENTSHRLPTPRHATHAAFITKTSPAAVRSKTGRAEILSRESQIRHDRSGRGEKQH